MTITAIFYHTFQLELSRLSRGLDCVSGGGITITQSLAECMGVNLPVARGYRNWLKHTGLAQELEDSLRLTDIGSILAKHDLQLRDTNSLWILHYYLCIDHRERSEAWYRLMNEYLTPNKRFTISDYKVYFEHRVSHLITNKRALKDDPMVAIRTYTREQGLGTLNIVEAHNKDSHVISRYPKYPNPQIIGYMLMDWWERHYPHDQTLTLSQLHEEPESIGRLLVATVNHVKQWIQTLSGYGLVAFSDSQHQPVTRLYFDSPKQLLEQYYERR